MQTKEKVYTDYRKIDEILSQCGAKTPFLCCGKSFKKTDAFALLEEHSNLVLFDAVRPNPLYEDMEDAAELFKSKNCDFMIAAGGGSPIDSAKMIKLMATNPGVDARFDLLQDNEIPLLCIPTTSGSGSEATKFAVFYSGEHDKHSVVNDGFLPDYVILDPCFLQSVPDYQRKCTCMDALCHGIESYWNVNSTNESKEYAGEAIRLFFEHKDAYINKEPSGNAGMLYASYYAGKAINISSTTSAHAMCYNLTMHCSTSHGHSVAVCLCEIWDYMLRHNEAINDIRGHKYILDTFDDIGKLMGAENAIGGLEIFRDLLASFDLPFPKGDAAMAREFSKTVNTERLKNNPTLLRTEDVESLYRKVLQVK